MKVNGAETKLTSTRKVCVEVLLQMGNYVIEDENGNGRIVSKHEFFTTLATSPKKSFYHCDPKTYYGEGEGMHFLLPRSEANEKRYKEFMRPIWRWQKWVERNHRRCKVLGKRGKLVICKDSCTKPAKCKNYDNRPSYTPASYDEINHSIQDPYNMEEQTVTRLLLEELFQFMGHEKTKRLKLLVLEEADLAEYARKLSKIEGVKENTKYMSLYRERAKLLSEAKAFLVGKHDVRTR